MSGQREFSEEFLARATRPSADLITDAATVNEFAEVAELAGQFHGEVCGMLYGYLTWPKIIRSNVENWRDEAYWHSMNAEARRQLAGELPRAAGCFAYWEKARDSLTAAAEGKDASLAIQISGQWQEQALNVHDAYMNYAAILASELARRFGAEAMQEVFIQIMDPGAMDMPPQMPFRQRVENLIRFTRMHLLPFRLAEDDEKMTFIASPCPSGGRQILAGLYEPEAAGEIIRGESPITYNRTELPSYCCHESALEAAGIRRFGAPPFVVEPSAQLGHLPCHVHVYKDPSKIPEHIYERLGLKQKIEGADNLILRQPA